MASMVYMAIAYCGLANWICGLAYLRVVMFPRYFIYWDVILWIVACWHSTSPVVLWFPYLLSSMLVARACCGHLLVTIGSDHPISGASTNPLSILTTPFVCASRVQEVEAGYYHRWVVVMLHSWLF